MARTVAAAIIAVIVTQLLLGALIRDTRALGEDSECTKAPQFYPNGGLTKLWRTVGSSATLNCTAVLWESSSSEEEEEEECVDAVQWSKDGLPLTNNTVFTTNTSWSAAPGQRTVQSLLNVSFRELGDFGIYSCSVRNFSLNFSLENTEGPSHTAAVYAAIAVLLLLGMAVLVYSRCHLNIKLWCRDTYGDLELNDGKLFDAYISYVNNYYDRKFVNFILKPHLENKNGYKVHLNENNILPGADPSAELLMNMSRSRRLIVVLSFAYLQQDWCTTNFRQGLLRLLEVSHQPIIITLEGQSKHFMAEVKQQLMEQQHRLTVLTWRHNSVTPSSVFWKQLALAMPRKFPFPSESAGDPQILLQDDKDPMLTLDPDYLDCRSDGDPAGDLGVRFPVYKPVACRAPVLPVTPASPAEQRAPDIDVSDLGSRNYGARSDFYCLVTKDDV